MKVSLKWLREYVEVPDDNKALCDKLDLTGTGVEGADEKGASFSNVVVGQILAKEHHPNSDHMWVCSVDVGDHNLGDDGSPAPLQIVCGAQNFKALDKIAVALVGAQLPGDVKIKKSKLRGIKSCGMNCSSRELGLGAESDGIMILPEDAPIGVDFADYLDLTDTVLDLEITPNRPDCLSMEGMAREVGAIYRESVADVCTDYTLEENGQATDELVDVSVKDPDRCLRYAARVIDGIKVGPSPDWMVERLTAAGMRSINNVVDATNYVLMLLGQPLHAFDFDKVDKTGSRAQIIVRAAADGEHLTTLDGEDRTLSSDMTVIASPQRPLALAGVMGGLDSEVTDQTTSIMLETAVFDAAHTSRTSRNLGLMSESSIRYERKVDAAAVERNADFAAALIVALCGGSASKGLIDWYPQPVSPCDLRFRMPRFCKMMGADIPRAEAEDILTRLGCKVSDAGDDTMRVIAPTYRPDLEREIDLYEEVLRLYGMAKIPRTLPGGRGRVGRKSRHEKIIDRLHTTLQACGLNETMTYSFAGEDDLIKLRMDPSVKDHAVHVINPINADQSVMRQSIIPGLLRSVAFNQHHDCENVQLYEIGNVFTSHEGRKLPREQQKLAGVLVGSMANAQWNRPATPFDFFDGKGVLEAIARELALPKVRFKAADADKTPFLQPGRAAYLIAGGATIGWVGEIHPLAVKAFEAEAPVVAFELDIDHLEASTRPSRDYHDVSEFPAVRTDIAFVVDEGVTAEQMMQRITSAGGKILDDVQLFDIYRDEERLGAGKKSMAFALVWRALDRTLKGAEVDKAQAKLITKVGKATGAEVRAR